MLLQLKCVPVLWRTLSTPRYWLKHQLFNEPCDGTPRYSRTLYRVLPKYMYFNQFQSILTTYQRVIFFLLIKILNKHLSSFIARGGAVNKVGDWKPLIRRELNIFWSIKFWREARSSHRSFPFYAKASQISILYVCMLKKKVVKALSHVQTGAVKINKR